MSRRVDPWIDGDRAGEYGSPATRRAPAVAAALLVPICLIYLWFPGDADQTLFELGADKLARGAVYYRDFWDIKQPGIYWVYQLGALLGVGVVGPRLVELAGALLGAAVVWRLSATWTPHVLARVLSPVLLIGSYLLFTHHGGVVVVEGLTVPLLVGIVALTWPADPGGGPPRAAWRWAAAGLLGGLVGVLKTFYLPLPALLMVGALVASRAPLARRGRVAAAGIAGAAVPLAATCLYFGSYGAWRLFWMTTFEVPLATAGRPVMSDNRQHFLEMGVALAALMLPLATVAVVTARRRGTGGRELTLSAATLLALVLAWPQFPTPYRLLVLVGPLGMLAVVGLGVLVGRAAARDHARPHRPLAVLLAVLAVLALPSMRGPQRLLFATGQVPTWGLGEADRNARDEVLIHEYPSQDVAPVRGKIRPGDSVYVIGHPQPYQLLHVEEAIEIAGWGSKLQPSLVWRERDRELVRSRPLWVFIETEMSRDVEQLAPRFTTVLAVDYRRIATTPRGIWYRNDRPGIPAGVPGDNQLANKNTR
jgi:hypothetical protein